MNDVAFAVALVAVAAAVAVTAIVLSRRNTKEVPLDLDRLRALQADWRGPEELLFRSTPRNVRYTNSARAGIALVAAAGLATVVLAAVFVPAVLRDQQNLALLGREGIPGSGIVTRQRTTHHKDSTNYYVAYAYEVDGRRYTSESRISRASNDRLTTGSAVPIHYAPSRPEVSRIDASVDDPPWIKLLLFLPALFVLAVPWRFAQMKKLLAWGTPVGALVTRNAPTKGGRAIRYAYLDPTGAVVTKTEVVRSRDAPAAGDVMTVVCDPNKPRRAGRYPFSTVTLDR